MDLWQLNSTLPLLHCTSNILLWPTSVLSMPHLQPPSIHPCFPLVPLSCPCLPVSLISVPKLPCVRGWPLFCSEAILEFFQLWPQMLSTFFGPQLLPSSRNTLEFLLFWPPSSSPQHYHALTPPQYFTQYLLQRLFQDLHLLQRSLRDLFWIHTLQYKLCSNILQILLGL